MQTWIHEDEKTCYADYKRKERSVLQRKRRWLPSVSVWCSKIIYKKCNNMVYSLEGIMKAKTGGIRDALERKDCNQMRKEFVERVLAQEKSKSALCREYGISRPTGDKWLARYLTGKALENQSSAPHSKPRKTPPETKALIVDYRREHPAIGAVKIRKILENKGHTQLPSARTVNNILKRNGMITREASLAARPIQRFEKSIPNEMWQGDYKGHFAMKNGKRCPSAEHHRRLHPVQPLL